MLTSTSEVYGTAQYVPIDEKHPLRGQSPYAATKIGADALGESYHRAFGLPVAILRPFNTFGPRQSARAIIPTIISQALTRPSVRLGSLDPRRDLTYVKDTVAGFVAHRRLRRRDGPGRQHRPGRRPHDRRAGRADRRPARPAASPSRPTPTGSGPPRARSAGSWPAPHWPANSWAGRPGTRSTRRWTRRSPGSATTSTVPGRCLSRPESDGFTPTRQPGSHVIGVDDVSDTCSPPCARARRSGCRHCAWSSPRPRGRSSGIWPIRTGTMSARHRTRPAVEHLRPWIIIRTVVVHEPPQWVRRRSSTRRRRSFLQAEMLDQPRPERQECGSGIDQSVVHGQSRADLHMPDAARRPISKEDHRRFSKVASVGRGPSFLPP